MTEVADRYGRVNYSALQSNQALKNRMQVILIDNIERPSGDE